MLRGRTTAGDILVSVIIYYVLVSTITRVSDLSIL